MEPKKSTRANLENKKIIFTQIGMIISLALVFLAFEYKSYEARSVVLPPSEPGMWEEDLIPITSQPLEKPPPPAQVVRIQTIDDHLIPDEPVFIDVSITPDIPLAAYIPPPAEEAPIVDDVPRPIAEVMPEFPGGTGALMKFLAEAIRYPPIARERGIQGIVFVSFVIERDGSVSNVEVLRGIGGGCDEEAVRVVETMPRWEPGRQAGKTVRVSYNLPMRFILR
jgi:periplasmic protein TonB